MNLLNVDGFDVFRQSRLGRPATIVARMLPHGVPASKRSCARILQWVIPYTIALVPKAYPSTENVRKYVALAFALPRVAEVSVVRHQHHEPPAFVRDAADVRRPAIGAPFRCVAAAPQPVVDRGNLRNP